MAADRVLAAGRALLRDSPKASMAEIAAAVGVSRSTAYRRFGSRQGLLQALALEPDPGTRERVLAAALELVGRDGLARLSMDEVAAAAGVSRASLYRLLPGKPALFRELLIAFSPLEAIGETVERMRDRPPDEVLPAVALRTVTLLAGRVGVVRTLLFEVTGASADAAEAARYLLESGVGRLAGYLAEQMAAGRLRPMHPLLALQAFAGPLLFHLITRSVTERELGFAPPLEEVAAALAENWLRAMRPEPEGGDDGG